MPWVALPDGTHTLGVSPDGVALVAVGERVMVISVASGERLVDVPPQALPIDGLVSMAVANGAARIVLAQGYPLLWQPFGGRPYLLGKLAQVNQVGITADGRYVSVRASLASALYAIDGPTLWKDDHEAVPTLATDGTVVLLRDSSGWTMRTLPELDVVERLEEPTGELARPISVLQADTLAVFRDASELIIADGPDQLVSFPNLLRRRVVCADRFVIWHSGGSWLEVFDVRARALHARIACPGAWSAEGGYVAVQVAGRACVLRLADLPPGEQVP